MVGLKMTPHVKNSNPLKVETWISQSRVNFSWENCWNYSQSWHSLRFQGITLFLLEQLKSITFPFKTVKINNIWKRAIEQLIKTIESNSSKWEFPLKLLDLIRMKQLQNFKSIYSCQHVPCLWQQFFYLYFV